MGAWVSYGIGCETGELPAFCVMISNSGGGQPLYDRLWGSAFLPSRYQGVKFRSGGDPVLFLSNPEGFPTARRRTFLDALGELNRASSEEFGDPEIAARAAQYEMAFRMQSSVPDLTDISKEPAHTFELYGEDARTPGTFATNCLLARRLAERGVRFIQLYHRDWDHHGELPANLPKRCKDVDQASAGLVADLAQRGMLDDTLSDLGRRIRAHRLLPGKAHRDGLWPRSPWPLFHRVDRGRRHEARHYHRRDRRLLLQYRQRPGARSRSASDHPPLSGDRPQAPHLPLPGPRFQTDRRGGRGGSAGARLALRANTLL
jgi:hypothetical protein